MIFCSRDLFGSHVVTAESLLWIFLGLAGCQGPDPQQYKSTVMVNITIGVMRSNSPYGSLTDWRFLEPALQLAALKARSLYEVNVAFVHRTHGPCNSTDFHIAARLAEELVTTENVDILIASPCTQEFLLEASLGLSYSMPVFAGYAPLFLKLEEFQNVVRLSYSTATQWSLFFDLCKKYNWTYVATIYDGKDDDQVAINTGTAFLCTHAVSKWRCRKPNQPV